MPADGDSDGDARKTAAARLLRSAAVVGSVVAIAAVLNRAPGLARFRTARDVFLRAEAAPSRRLCLRGRIVAAGKSDADGAVTLSLFHMPMARQVLWRLPKGDMSVDRDAVACRLSGVRAARDAAGEDIADALEGRIVTAEVLHIAGGGCGGKGDEGDKAKGDGASTAVVVSDPHVCECAVSFRGRWWRRDAAAELVRLGLASAEGGDAVEVVRPRRWRRIRAAQADRDAQDAVDRAASAWQRLRRRWFGAKY